LGILPRVYISPLTQIVPKGSNAFLYAYAGGQPPRWRDQLDLQHHKCPTG
jgi:hypothetical protein